jgi:hypothetical protein
MQLPLIDILQRILGRYLTCIQRADKNQSLWPIHAEKIITSSFSGMLWLLGAKQEGFVSISFRGKARAAKHPRKFCNFHHCKNCFICIPIRVDAIT